MTRYGTAKCSSHLESSPQTLCAQSALARDLFMRLGVTAKLSMPADFRICYSPSDLLKLRKQRCHGLPRILRRRLFYFNLLNQQSQLMLPANLLRSVFPNAVGLLAWFRVIDEYQRFLVICSQQFLRSLET